MAHEVVSSQSEGSSTPEGRIKQEIENHLEGNDMESPRSQAFFDFVDVQDAYRRNAKQLASNRPSIPSLPLIEEDIRKKKNTVRGYNKEYKEIAKKLDDLQTEEKLGGGLRNMMRSIVIFYKT